MDLRRHRNLERTHEFDTVDPLHTSIAVARRTFLSGEKGVIMRHADIQKTRAGSEDTFGCKVVATHPLVGKQAVRDLAIPNYSFPLEYIPWLEGKSGEGQTRALRHPCSFRSAGACPPRARFGEGQPPGLQVGMLRSE